MSLTLTIGGETAYDVINTADPGDVFNILMEGDESTTPLNESDGDPIVYVLEIDFSDHDSLWSVGFTPNSDYQWQWDGVMRPDAQLSSLKLHKGDPNDRENLTLVFTID